MVHQQEAISVSFPVQIWKLHQVVFVLCMMLPLSEKQYCISFKQFLGRIAKVSIKNVHTRCQDKDSADCHIRSWKLSVFF